MRFIDRCSFRSGPRSRRSTASSGRTERYPGVSGMGCGALKASRTARARRAWPGRATQPGMEERGRSEGFRSKACRAAAETLVPDGARFGAGPVFVGTCQRDAASRSSQPATAVPRPASPRSVPAAPAPEPGRPQRRSCLDELTAEADRRGGRAKRRLAHERTDGGGRQRQRARTSHGTRRSSASSTAAMPCAASGTKAATGGEDGHGRDHDERRERRQCVRQPGARTPSRLRTGRLPIRRTHPRDTATATFDCLTSPLSPAPDANRDVHVDRLILTSSCGLILIAISSTVPDPCPVGRDGSSADPEEKAREGRRRHAVPLPRPRAVTGARLRGG